MRLAAPVLALSFSVLAACGNGGDSTAQSAYPSPTKGAPASGGEYSTVSDLAAAVSCPVTQEVTALVPGSTEAAFCAGSGETTLAVFPSSARANAYVQHIMTVAEGGRVLLIGKNWVMRCTVASDCQASQGMVGGRLVGG